MSTHRIGAPGSVARFLDDHARDPSAKPWPAPWCVFAYARAGGIVLCGSGQTEEAAQQVRGAAAREHGWAVAVDVRTYGCRDLETIAEQSARQRMHNEDLDRAWARKYGDR